MARTKCSPEESERGAKIRELLQLANVSSVHVCQGHDHRRH